jgi:hypothetical protein
MGVIELKTDSAVFIPVATGDKTFEIRKNDRNFRCGDTLILRETQYTGAEMAQGQPLIYTGRTVDVEVLYVLNGPIYGLIDGWCIMSIKVN